MNLLTLKDRLNQFQNQRPGQWGFLFFFGQTYFKQKSHVNKYHKYNNKHNQNNKGTIQYVHFIQRAKIAFMTYKKKKVLERLKDQKSKDQIKKGCK